jgi:hypothetical protein
MLSILLVAAAVALFYGGDLSKFQPAIEWVKKLDPKKWVAVALVLAAVLLMPHGRQSDEPTPAPDTGPLILRGTFLGPSASDDASLVGALCNELADEIEFDGSQPEAEQYLKSGVAVDELRKAARILRCRGISIGDRQPQARDLIATYLDKNVGTDGGPLTPETRAAWVSAYRDIGRAASDAAQ